MHPLTDTQLIEGLAEFEKAVPGGLSLDDIPAMRAFMSELHAQVMAETPDIPGVVSSDYHAPGPAGAPDVLVRVYQPESRADTLPAMLWIHGGGYVLGSMVEDDLKAKELCLRFNCVLASVEYRRAPEHPFPAPLEDCYAALEWLISQAEPLGIDPKHVAIGGASAGGGLAAGLALLTRDRGKIDLCFQLLIYPMLDDSNVEQAGPDTPDAPLWTRANNLAGWKAYLGQEPGGEGISEYAAAYRAKDVSGLPPAYIGVGTPDLFHEEDIAYAQRLMRAGVPTELHVYADGFHAFDLFAVDSDVTQRFTADYTRIVRRALHGG